MFVIKDDEQLQHVGYINGPFAVANKNVDASAINGSLYNKNMSTLYRLYVPSEYDVTFCSTARTIASNAIYRISVNNIYTGAIDSIEEYGMTSVTMRDFIGEKNLRKLAKYAFTNCAVDLLDLSKTQIGYISANTLLNCKVKILSLPDNLAYIEERAFNCKGLTYIDIHNVNDIQAGAFVGLSDLCWIRINGNSNNHNANFKTIEGVLYTKDNVLVCVPPYWSSYKGKRHSYVKFVMDKSVTEIAPYAFWSTHCNCVKICEGIKFIPSYAFFISPKLELVQLPVSLEEIADHAFEGCKKMKQITIPENVKVIRESAFGSCSSLEEIKFTGNTLLERNIIPYCSKIKNIIIGCQLSGDTEKSILALCDYHPRLTITIPAGYVVQNPALLQNRIDNKGLKIVKC